MKNKKLCFSLLLGILFLIFGSVQAQKQKMIQGKITYQSTVLSNVHVVNTTRKVLTKSDAQGNYEIPAKIGDEITYSFIGLKTITIIVEDVTSVLNIKMTEDVNQLDDIVIKAKVYDDKPEIIPLEEAVNMEFKDQNGRNIKPARSKGVVHYFDNDDMKTLPAALSLERVLSGRFTRVTLGKIE